MHVKNWRLCSQTWNKFYHWVWDGGKCKLCAVYHFLTLSEQLEIEQFSVECWKTERYFGQSQNLVSQSNPNQIHVAGTKPGRRSWVNCDWFWFYFWLNQKVEWDIFKPITKGTNSKLKLIQIIIDIIVKTA